MVQEFKRIIAPIDGSEEAKNAARKALFLAKHLGVDVTALYIVDTSLLAKFPAPEDITTFDKAARKNDLIVMGSKGMTALDRILIGSVSEKVMHHALCPVLIVRG